MVKYPSYFSMSNLVPCTTSLLLYLSVKTPTLDQWSILKSKTLNTTEDKSHSYTDWHLYEFTFSNLAEPSTVPTKQLLLEMYLVSYLPSLSFLPSQKINSVYCNLIFQYFLDQRNQSNRRAPSAMHTSVLSGCKEEQFMVTPLGLPSRRLNNWNKRTGRRCYLSLRGAQHYLKHKLHNHIDLGLNPGSTYKLPPETSFVTSLALVYIYKIVIKIIISN